MKVILDAILAANDWLGGVVWGPPFLVLFLAIGVYLTIRLSGFQFTHLGHAWTHTFGRALRRTKETGEGAITSFQAVSAAMAATVGVGNIAGVSTALFLGGPGAIFWMWMTALVGMATKFGEASLGLKYREVDPETGKVSGGAMYYIEKGLGKRWKPMAVAFGILTGVAALGIGNMVQANTMAHTLELGFGIPAYATGIGAVILVGIVTIGGIKRIGLVASRLVPFMAIAYVLCALIVIAVNFVDIPAAFGAIFYHAFTPVAAVGGFGGAGVAAAMRYGVARGVFSNEAGLGGASIAHAQAKNTPARQGMWGIWEVFIDTIVVCTMTALVVLTTGALSSGETGAGLAIHAFNTGLGQVGSVMIFIALPIFAYTTMLTWSFYGEKGWEYVFGKHVVFPYRLLFIAFLFVGAIGGLTEIWAISDTMNGLMAAPNLIALLVLAGVMAKVRGEYFKGPVKR